MSVEIDAIANHASRTGGNEKSVMLVSCLLNI